jgi:hypothetical protein
MSETKDARAIDESKTNAAHIELSQPAPTIRSGVEIAMPEEVEMKQILGLGLVAAMLSATGCAERPFVRADQPMTTQGVTVALTGQKCGREGWNEAYDVLDLEMVVNVANGTMSPIEVVPAEMRLLANGNSAVPRSSSPKWEDAPLQIAPNSNANVRVHFYRRGNAKCDQNMQLSLDGSIDQAGRRLALPPLSFVPSRSDT